jgi:simple sugar transport system permease protein
VADATLAIDRPAPRPGIPEWLEAVLVRVAAVLAALLVCAVLLALQGHNPWAAYADMASGAFGSRFAIEQTLLKAIPLVLTTLGVTLTFTAGLWNIGAEGQLIIGALAASWLALNYGTLPALVLLPGMVLLGLLGGALWALVPAVPRAWVGMNEVISTLLLNYVAVLVVDYLVFGAWADPTAFNFPYSPAFSVTARLPMLFGDVHLGLVFALVATVIVAVVIGHTAWGYEIRTIGASPGAARYAGMPVTRDILVAMAGSGALAGLAGMAEVSGMIFRVQQGLSPGYGYSAIIIAWLAKLNPWAAVPVAVLFAGLLNGGFALQTSKVPAAITYMIQAAILFLVVAGESLLARVRRARAAAAQKAALGGAR